MVKGRTALSVDGVSGSGFQILPKWYSQGNYDVIPFLGRVAGVLLGLGESMGFALQCGLRGGGSDFRVGGRDFWGHVGRARFWKGELEQMINVLGGISDKRGRNKDLLAWFDAYILLLDRDVFGVLDSDAVRRGGSGVSGVSDAGGSAESNSVSESVRVRFPTHVLFEEDSAEEDGEDGGGVVGSGDPKTEYLTALCVGLTNIPNAYGHILQRFYEEGIFFNFGATLSRTMSL